MTKWYVVILIACLPGARISKAQISSATLVGTVTDSSGAVVAGATVETRNVGTESARSTVTDANGEYVIPNLPAAHYSVTVTKTGPSSASCFSN